jgi:hypothetical protein
MSLYLYDTKGRQKEEFLSHFIFICHAESFMIKQRIFSLQFLCPTNVRRPAKTLKVFFLLSFLLCFFHIKAAKKENLHLQFENNEIEHSAFCFHGTIYSNLILLPFTFSVITFSISLILCVSPLDANSHLSIFHPA